jgi:hypothetical protein
MRRETIVALHLLPLPPPSRPVKAAEEHYSPHRGIEFDSPARQGRSVFGNVIFGETPIADLGHGESGNIVCEQVRAVERSASPQ